MELVLDEKTKHFIRPGTLDLFVVKEINASYKSMDIQPEDVVMDVGGNIGAFARWAANQGAKVISYEPCEDNFVVLQKNIEGLESIFPVNKALISGDAKTVDFYRNNGKNKGMHSAVKVKGREVVTVQAANFVSELELHRPNKLKVDIEGGEYDILLDYKMPDFVKVLAIEVHLNRREWRHDKSPKILQQLQDQFTEVLVQPKITEGNWATVGIYRR